MTRGVMHEMRSYDLIQYFSYHNLIDYDVYLKYQ